jgi:hypothetical protein
VHQAMRTGQREAGGLLLVQSIAGIYVERHRGAYIRTAAASVAEWRHSGTASRMSAAHAAFAT